MIISDTHYLRLGDKAIFEFQSQQQEYRIETALRLAAALEPELVIHLGDLVSATPEKDEFVREMDEALRQMTRLGIEARHVAGNHDVGDKPDPLMPMPPVQAASLAWYHGRIGRSWYSFDRKDCHFVVLNALLMNSTLPDAERQRDWLQHDLDHCQGDRIFVFLHMPPYLWDEDESAFGHYEIIDAPARNWLLDIVRSYHVELLVAGHVHFAFFDRIGTTRFHVLSSTSFTRAVSSYILGGCPPERGLDDVAKLGFYLFRVLPDRTDVHFIRTNGATTLPEPNADLPRRLITRTSAGFAHSPLGLTLRRPLAPSVETPIGRKSVIRKRVRNDYPLLACLELGLKHIRVPWTDLSHPLQSRRLAISRKEGIRITVTSLWSSTLDLPAILGRHRNQIDTWEIQVPGTLWPEAECLQAIKQCSVAFQLPMALSAILPKQVVPGKRYHETRFGYRLNELEELNRRLARGGTGVARILCRMDVDSTPWELAAAVRRLLPFSHIGDVDFALGLQSGEDQNASRVAEATMAMVLLPGSRLFFEPLVDLDRDIEVTRGLLDSMYNPRKAFHVLRCLNTVLFSSWQKLPSFQTVETDTRQARIKTLVGPERTLSLLLPSETIHDSQYADRFNMLSGIPDEVTATVYWLLEGTSWTTTLARARQAVEASNSLALVSVTAPAIS